MDNEQDNWRWLQSTRELQETSFGVDYSKMTGDALADYVTWNATALTAELGEFLNEVGWKNWAHPRGWVNREQAVGELIDIGHFLANLCAALDVTDEEWETRYQAKQGVNAKRQEEGYTGLNKCAKCHRDRTEAGVERMLVGHTNDREPVYRVCCSVCAHPVDLDADDEPICTVCGTKRADAGVYSSTEDLTLPDGTKMPRGREHCGVCHSPVVRSTT